MRRPLTWAHWALLGCALVALIEYAALSWLAPRYVRYGIERATGGVVEVGEVRLDFPASVSLSGLRSIHNTAETALSIQQLIIEPQWLTAASSVLRLNAVEIDRPLIRVTRTGTDTMVWPSVPPTSPAAAAAGLASPPTPRATPARPIRVGSLKVNDGVVEFVDDKVSPPFHGVLHHVSVVAGPLALPFGSSQMSFAVRGELVGEQGHAAPIYCSGWVDLAAQDLQANCRLEAIALAAFEPYFQHKAVKVRVYESTLESTSQWIAKSNTLQARLQLVVGNASEADVSVHGTNVMDVKTVATDEAPRLTGEFQIAGPLNDPGQWHSEFVPGDDRVQELMKPLVERGIAMVNIPFGGRKIGVNISPTASQEEMTSIEAASKRVEAELEILAVPVPQVEAPATTEAGATASSEPVATSAPPTATETPTTPTPPAPPSPLPPAVSPAPPKTQDTTRPGDSPSGIPTVTPRSPNP